MNSICTCVQKERVVLFNLFNCNLRKWSWQFFWVIRAFESSLWLYKLFTGQRDVVTHLDLAEELLAYCVGEGDAQITIFMGHKSMTKGSTVIFFRQVLIMKLKFFLRRVFPFDLLLERKMKVCRIYSNRFRKLDLVFSNVMEKLGRKLKAKNKSIH